MHQQTIQHEEYVPQQDMLHNNVIAFERSSIHKKSLTASVVTLRIDALCVLPKEEKLAEALQAPDEEETKPEEEEGGRAHDPNILENTKTLPDKKWESQYKSTKIVLALLQRLKCFKICIRVCFQLSSSASLVSFCIAQPMSELLYSILNLAWSNDHKTDLPRVRVEKPKVKSIATLKQNDTTT
eukprot:4089307-Amphidinium_carterae.1